MNPQQRARRVGWIGVGAMGRPMCLNLRRAGHAVTAFDKNPARLAALGGDGVAAAASPRALLRDCEVVFSTIFDDNGLRDIVLGDDGLAAEPAPGRIYVDMSTVSPVASAEMAPALARQGIAYLRAPVSGTVTLAESAQLSAFVSGPREAFEQVRPLLACLTARQSLVGGADEARVVKLMINLLVFTSTAAIGEALDFGARCGLDRALMVDAINDSIVGSAHYRAKADKLKHRDYSPAGSIALVLKDLSLALHVAADQGAALPISGLVRRTLADMDRAGLGALDVTALADAAELLAPRAPVPESTTVSRH